MAQIDDYVNDRIALSSRVKRDKIVCLIEIAAVCVHLFIHRKMVAEQ